MSILPSFIHPESMQHDKPWHLYHVLNQKMISSLTHKVLECLYARKPNLPFVREVEGFLDCHVLNPLCFQYHTRKDTMRMLQDDPILGGMPFPVIEDRCGDQIGRVVPPGTLLYYDTEGVERVYNRHHPPLTWTTWVYNESAIHTRAPDENDTRPMAPMTIATVYPNGTRILEEYILRRT